MKCKYYSPHMDTLRELCRCLYKLKGCGAGGLLHVVLDDNNYNDHFIKYCLDCCLKNPDREESELGALICKELLKMSSKERAVFDWYWMGSDLECTRIACDECRYLDYLDLIDEV